MFRALRQSLPLKGRYALVTLDHNQWYCTPEGWEKLSKEVSEMEQFPFDTILLQDPATGRLSYIMLITMNGVQHKVQLTYDRDHPDFEMDAFVHWPTLSKGVMGHHYYGQNRPCYIKPWSRGYRAIHCAVQVAYWLDDYYKILNGRRTVPFDYRRMRFDVLGGHYSFGY